MQHVDRTLLCGLNKGDAIFFIKCQRYHQKSFSISFDVDPEQVETNLVQNAKVTLKGIEIKQRRQGGLLVFGSGGQMKFSWAWDTGSFVTDSKLTVKGVDVHIRLIKDDEQFENSSGVNSSPESILGIE